ncbi:MAG: DUF3857 and transglutaminase domain-containing protein [Saprospiraceae bacterium]|nr:DUF3857 and transglutaminase domain-containing protein [Saprospiraceae bacterium]
MIRFFSLLLLINFLAVPAFSQKKELKVKFGKLSDKEINMQSYEADPSAMAVVLFDIGELRHRYDDANGFTMYFEVHTRIKIFKKEMLDMADVEIFHDRDEKVTDLKAAAYNFENGKIVESKLEKDNVFLEELTKDDRLTKFSIPGAREGSIIEYTYTVTNTFMPNGWVFQQVEVPTVWSEFKSSVPSYVQFKKFSQGWEPFTLAEESTDTESLQGNISYEVSKLHFIQENVPGLKSEPYVNSLKDYRSSILFDVQAVYEIDFVPSGNGGGRLVNTIPKQYNKSWSKIGKNLLEDLYQPHLKVQRFTEDAAKRYAAGKATALEKATAIYEHIGKEYQLEDYEWLRPSVNIEKLTKERKGSPTDLNLLFINMMRIAGAKVYPMLISTTSHGRVLEFNISTDEFNRVIAAVEAEDSTIILVDVAGFPNPIGLLPQNDLNNSGLLLLSEEEVIWFDIKNKMGNKSALIGNFAIADGGEVSGNVVYQTSGYKAASNRKKAVSLGAEKMLAEQFKDWVTDGAITDVKLEKVENWQEANLKTEFNLATNTLANAAGDKIYLSPMVGLGQHENPFKNPDRKFDVNLGAIKEESFNLTFKLPAGYKVEEMPKNAKMSFGEQALLFDYMIEANAEQLKVNVRMRQKTDNIPATEYADLQQFYSAMATKLEEQIVLTKF